MALSTFSDLKTSIAAWMHRGDLTSVIPDFIALAEKRVLRDLIKRGGHYLIEASSTLTPSSNVAALPADYFAIRSLVSATTPNEEILDVPLSVLKSAYGLSGNGKAYSIVGANIQLSPDAGNTDVVLNYYLQPAALSDSNTTNELFPTLSDAYLYASLIEATLYVKGDPSGWVSAYDSALGMIANHHKMRGYGNALQIRAA